MLELFVKNLNNLRKLDTDDVRAVEDLPVRVEKHSANFLLVREGSRPDFCCILLRGYACRQKTTSSGERQIVSFHIPGDILDVQHLELAQADHNVQTITASTVAWIRKVDLQKVLDQRPAIRKAIWRGALVDASIFREWVLNVGRRDGVARVAHMLCELVARLEAARLGSAVRLELPMTQEQIADATGMTPIHVNRMLQELSARGVIVRDRRDVRIVDWAGLRKLADFDPAYLHLAA